MAERDGRAMNGYCWLIEISPEHEPEDALWLKVMQLVDERDGKAKRPLDDVVDPDDQPALERVGQSLEVETAKQKNPHPPGSLAYAAWVFARLGGWTGYTGKPGPIVMLRGLTQCHAIKHDWSLRNA